MCELCLCGDCMLIKKIIEKQLDKLLRFQSFQDYINNRCNRKGFIHIKEEILNNAYYYHDRYAFNVNDQVYSIFEVLDDYNFSDIQKDDIVLDMGANIGAFSILISNKAKHVYAVEPIFSDIIQKNVLKNDIKNITVLEMGLGYGKKNIIYGKHNKIVNCYSLSEIIDSCGGHIDFLKMDCEGGEWCIKPHELKGIRRIEAEIHNFDGKHNHKDFISMLCDTGFIYKIKEINNILTIVHATNLSIK